MHTPRLIFLLALAATTPPASADLLLQRYLTPPGQEAYGFAIDGRGDLNGDGITDWVTASVLLEPEVVQTTYLYFGAPELPAEPSLRFQLPSGANFMDHAISCRGDVNGDGYDDLLLGQGFANYKSGLAQIYFGGAPMDTIADLTMQGEHNADWFGSSVSILGDINGDGYDDFGVCAVKHDAGGDNTGRVYLYFGGPEVDAEADLILDGDTERGYFGSTLDGRADINGDGWTDFLVGQSLRWVNGYWKGAIFLFYGGPALDDQPDRILIDPEAPWAEFGAINCFAGDLNGDGYADLAAADTWGSSGGVVHAYWGGPAMDNQPDWRITDPASAATFGNDISPLGDLNGDGGDDLLIGDWLSGAFWNPPGRACVSYGARFPDSQVDNTHVGALGDALGEPVCGIGDINADGLLDYAIVAGGSYIDIWSAEPSAVRIDAFTAVDSVAHPGEKFQVQVQVTNPTATALSTRLWLEGYLSQNPAFHQRLAETPLALESGETQELLFRFDIPQATPVGTQALMLRIGPDPREWLNGYLPVVVE